MLQGNILIFYDGFFFSFSLYQSLREAPGTLATKFPTVFNSQSQVCLTGSQCYRVIQNSNVAKRD